MIAACSISPAVGLDRALRCHGELSEPDQCLDDLRVVFGRQLRQEVVSYSGPRACEIGVGFVLAVRLPQLRQVGSNLPTVGCEQGPHKRDPRVGRQDPLPWDSGEPARSGASDDPVEDGLGLIVARVSDRHNFGVTGPGDLGQPVVPGAARVRLEVPGLDRPPLTEVEWQSERRREVGHERGISPRRLTAHAVVQVRDRQPQARRRSQLVQHT